MAYLTRAVAALALVVSAAPAFASPAIPEPGTMSLFGVGVVGAIVASRFIRRGK